jgi:hypothetical protein
MPWSKQAFCATDVHGLVDRALFAGAAVIDPPLDLGVGRIVVSERKTPSSSSYIGCRASRPTLHSDPKDRTYTHTHTTFTVVVKERHRLH